MNLLWKYGLGDIGDIEECLKSPLSKLKWKTKVNQSLQIFNCCYSKSGCTKLLEREEISTGPNSVRVTPRVSTTLKLLCDVRSSGIRV